MPSCPMFRRPAKRGSRAPTRRYGSACGGRPGCRPISSPKSTPTCAGRWPTRASRKGWRTWATTRWTCRRRSSRALCAAKSRTTSASSGTRGSSRSSESLERHAGQALQLLERKAFDHFNDMKPVGLHLDHREVGVDAVDAACARQRVGAALDDLAFAVLGEVLHHHQHLLRAHREIHSAAHRRDRVCAAGVPVGEVAGHGHLERPQDAEIEVPAADHAEGIGMVEIRSAGKKRHRLLSGVDEVFVFFAGCGLRPDTEDAILAVENDFAAFRQVVSDQGRQTDPEVDVRPIRDVAGNTRRDLFLVELLHQAAFRIDGATRTTRLTKMPGVTMDSGSRTPSSTVSRTCTTAHLAALAMIGPKFRALLR